MGFCVQCTSYSKVDPDEDASDAILNYKAALIVFENALKTITGSIEEYTRARIYPVALIR